MSDTPFIPILTFHGLVRSKGASANSLYTLTEDQFADQMRYLSENHYHSVSLEAVMTWVKGEPLPERSIAITFDDGRESDFSIARPILKRHGCVATFFVNPGTLGQAGYLRYQELRQMSAEEMEIGSHGFDHLFLTQLDEKGLRHQIAGSKERLEQLLQKEILFFSVPRGRYTPHILEIVKETGYRAACTSEIGLNQRDLDLYHLKRWAMKRPYTLDDFISVVEGTPKGNLLFEHFLKRSAHRILGHTLYEALRNKMVKEEIS